MPTRQSLGTQELRLPLNKLEHEMAFYQGDCEKTESPVTEAMCERAVKALRLWHGVTGVQTESGELSDQIKRHVFYGKPLDETNLKEELGDLLWYIALVANVLNMSLAEVMERNLAKLRVRYPEKFTADRALNRDVEAERVVLEGGSAPTSDSTAGDAARMTAEGGPVGLAELDNETA